MCDSLRGADRIEADGLPAEPEPSPAGRKRRPPGGRLADFAPPEKAVTAAPLLAAALLLAPAEPPAAPTLSAGFAAVEITPPPGMRRANSYYELFAEEVHDPLFARAAYFGDASGGTAVLIVCDLTSLAPSVSDRVRAEVSRTLGVPPAAIAVAATHTHGGVLYDGPLRDLFHERALARDGKDPAEPIDFVRFVSERCLSAARRAAANAAPVTLSASSVAVPGVSFNRRFHMRDGSVRFNPGYRNPEILRPAGPVDEELTAFWFAPADPGGDSSGGEAAGGCLASFPMHTAVFTGDRIGADFPGVIHRRLREAYGENFGLVYGQGTSGNTNHVDVSEPGLGMDSADYSKIVGDRLADALLAARPDAEPVAPVGVAGAVEVVALPIREASAEDLERADERLARLGTAATPPFLELVDAYSLKFRQTLREKYGETAPSEVRAIRLGESAAVVTLPYEVFVEIGLDVKARSPFEHTLILTLEGSIDAYVPDRRAYPQGAYEVVNSPFEPGCGELLADAAVRLLEGLKSGDE